MKKYSYCVFIGRFAPPHKGHLALIDEAFSQAEKVIIVAGSVNKARDTKNPWTANEREQMIKDVLTPDQRENSYIIKLRDYAYNDIMWQNELLTKVSDIVGDNENIALIGHEHDRSSFYLFLFPQWTLIDMPNLNQFPHATNIRDKYFTYDNGYKNSLHQSTVKYLEEFKTTDTFKKLKDEYDFLTEYKSKWIGSPFQPIFHTVDSVVIKSGHILLVRRKGKLGKGLMALPGGFLNADETLRDGALRELREETVINISKEELNYAIADQKTFDSVGRSLRGRTITTAFLIDLGSGILPKVKGSDDAEKAFWMPINEIHMKDSEFFEDHYHIISYFVNRY